jgi:gluconolactonase
MDVNAQGNLCAVRPGGLTVFAPDGTRLGALFTGIATSKVALGGAQGKTVFVSASSPIWHIAAARRRAR